MPDWSEILAQHGGIVWKTVRRIVGNDHDARDCFQETFVAAWEYSRQHQVVNWPGLLKRLATARALDLLRSRLRASTLVLSALPARQMMASQRHPPAIAEASELFDRLRAALVTLPAEQADACCLRFLEMMSYEEISEQLGVTVNHVGVLLHRAKAALQVELADFQPAVPQQARDHK